MNASPRKPRRRRFSRRMPTTAMGTPKFKRGDIIEHFTIIFYHGHSFINKRTAQQMAKAQHWYRCRCDCGAEENRSQQELIDPRREKKCYICRSPNELLQPTQGELL